MIGDPFDTYEPLKPTRDIVVGGRYRLPDPFPNEPDPAYKRIKKDGSTSWMRATRLAGAIADSYALSQWSQRHAMKGITLDQSLFDLACTLDPERDREEYNELAERAKKAASANERAHLGTQIHDVTEVADRDPTIYGDLPFDTPFSGHVKTWQEAIASYGIEIIDIEEVVIVSDLGVAGRHDRIGRTTRDIVLIDLSGQTWVIPKDVFIVVDLKTGKDLSLAWHEIAIQLAVYANADMRWVPTLEGVEETQGRWYVPRAPMARQVAIVIHMPALEGGMTMYAVDIRRGWEAARLARDVLKWHSQGKLAYVMAPPA